MKFDDVYQLTELVESDNERDTYVAREIAGGGEVFIHLLKKNPEQGIPLLTVAKRYLTSQPDASVLDLKIGTLQNEDCLVTKAAPELQNIRRAIDEAPVNARFDKASMWRVPSAVETQPDTESNAQVGEFTRMFSQEKANPASSQGEFTRMFQATVETPSLTQKSTTPTLAAAAAAGAGRDGLSDSNPPSGPPSSGSTFTQMFSASPAQSPPGEFTRMFQSQPPAPRSAEPTSPPAPSSQDSEPGKFTRMFQGQPPAGGVELTKPPVPQ